MIKVYLCVGFSILFSLFYVFSSLFYQSEDSKGEVPTITNEAVNLLSVKEEILKAKIVKIVPMWVFCIDEGGNCGNNGVRRSLPACANAFL